MTKVSAADLLSLVISRGLQRLTPGEDTLPDVSAGVRLNLEIPPTTETDGASASVDFRPQGDETVSLNFGSFIVIVTRDGCALVLTGGVIDTIKAFEPQHSRVLTAFDGTREAMVKVRDVSLEMVSTEEALKVRGRGGPL